MHLLDSSDMNFQKKKKRKKKLILRWTSIL